MQSRHTVMAMMVALLAAFSGCAHEQAASSPAPPSPQDTSSPPQQYPSTASEVLDLPDDRNTPPAIHRNVYCRITPGCSSAPKLLYVNADDGAIVHVFQTQPTQTELAEKINGCLEKAESQFPDKDIAFDVYHRDPYTNTWCTSLTSTWNGDGKRIYSSRQKLVGSSTVIESGMVERDLEKNRKAYSAAIAKYLCQYKGDDVGVKYPLYFEEPNAHPHDD